MAKHGHSGKRIRKAKKATVAKTGGVPLSEAGLISRGIHEASSHTQLWGITREIHLKFPSSPAADRISEKLFSEAHTRAWELSDPRIVRRMVLGQEQGFEVRPGFVPMGNGWVALTPLMWKLEECAKTRDRLTVLCRQRDAVTKKTLGKSALRSVYEATKECKKIYGKTDVSIRMVLKYMMERGRPLA